MQTTPRQRLSLSVIILISLIGGVMMFFRLFYQIPDFLGIIVVIIVIYTYSRLVAPIISETMIPEVIILFSSFLIFRLDELVMRSSFTEVLTKITSKIIVNILFAWELMFIIATIGILAFICKNQSIIRNNSQKWLFLLVIPIMLMIFLLIANITQYSFTVADSMSIIFYRSKDIIRIDIIRDCSGIYGMMIFACSFLLFGADTKRNVKWGNKQMFRLLFGGLIGVYFLNILRIITVINANLFIDLALTSIIHSYLGSILILLFVITYWSLIWRNTILKKENTHLEYDA